MIDILIDRRPNLAYLSITVVQSRDVIIDRLRVARAAESKSLAKILEINLSNSRDLDVTKLSREFRSRAGNSFANLFRGDDELSYEAILQHVVEKLLEAHRWKRTNNASPPNSQAKLIAHEEFIVFCVAASEKLPMELLNDEAAKERRLSAQAVLEEQVDWVVPAPQSSTATPVLGQQLARLAGPVLGAIPAAGLVVAATAGVIALGVALGVGVAALTEPSEKLVLRAVLVLIHIRKREEAVARLRAFSATEA